jgi:GntR family transcriptional regulator / MocR family aminotransferase
MEIFKTAFHIDRTSTSSVFSQVSKGVVNIIQRGVLRPSDRLPSVRKLAGILNIHPRTVVAAYEDLEAQGWIETLARKGVFVSSVLPTIKPIKLRQGSEARIDRPTTDESVQRNRKLKASTRSDLIIDDGFPDHRLAPTDLILREYRGMMKKSYAIRAATLGDSVGSEELRIVLSKFLRETRALGVDERSLCVTRGAQMGLYLICRTCLKKGSRVLVGEPNYRFANDLFEECGARLIRVPVENDGINTTRIAQICAKQKPDLLYIIPHHHHPTTVTLSPQKRIALLEIVEKYNLMVIEDDYDYDFHYASSPILPLASYLKGQDIFYLGSLSKAISNALRIGFICATPSAIERIGHLRRLVDLRGDTFFELGMSNFIKEGEFARHLKRMNRIYKERRDLMYELLHNNLNDRVTLIKPTGGMALWTTFHKSIDLKSLSTKAREMGLVMSDGTFYNTSKVNLNSTRFGFASKNESEISQFVDILKTLLKR